MHCTSCGTEVKLLDVPAGEGAMRGACLACQLDFTVVTTDAQIGETNISITPLTANAEANDDETKDDPYD